MPIFLPLWVTSWAANMAACGEDSFPSAFNFNSTNHTAEGFFARKISDMDKDVTEKCKAKIWQTPNTLSTLIT
jgi:hypothetical protein